MNSLPPPSGPPSSDDGFGDAVRSAFDEMFDEAGIDDRPPRLVRTVAVDRPPTESSRLPLLRVAAVATLIAVGAVVAVAVRGSQRSGTVESVGEEPGLGASVPVSTGPATTDPATTDPGTTDPGTTDPGTTDRPAAPETAWAQVDQVMQQLDVASGSVVSTLAPWASDTDAWGPVQIAASGDRAYFSSVSPSDQRSCDASASNVLTIPWPSPAFDQAGEQLYEKLAEGGERVLGISPDGNTLFYDQVTDCTSDPLTIGTLGGLDGSSTPETTALGLVTTQHGSLRISDLGSGEDRTVMTAAASEKRDGDEILDAAITPSGELVVALYPSGAVYRLQPTDGAVVERDGEMVAQLGQKQYESSQLWPGILSADDRSITITVHQRSQEVTVRRVSLADGSTTDLVAISGRAAVADDGYGNVLVVASAEAEVTPTDDQPVTVVTVPSSYLPAASW